MRMPPYHLRVHGVDHIGDLEPALFPGHFGVKHDLQEQIAELSPEFPGVSAVHRVEHFVRFLDEKWFQAGVRLFAVPGTAVRSSQSRLQRDQILERRTYAGGPPARLAHRALWLSFSFLGLFQVRRHSGFSSSPCNRTLYGTPLRPDKLDFDGNRVPNCTLDCCAATFR